ncbi:MAG: DUF2079 domain-containing protein [bacterium]|nr:DUF2079 domain-containing protein [bacterium]
MGVFDNTFWNTIHGRIMQNNLEEIPNHLGVHFSPWLFVLVPGYFLFQSSYYLLFIQTVALALGAIPLYYLAERILQKRNWALGIALAYLLYPSLHWINLFDFHEISFLVPLLLAAFYFIEIERWGWATLFLIASASTKEDAILVVLFVGLYLLIANTPISTLWRIRRWRMPDQAKLGLWNKKRLAGVLIILVACLYFLVTIKILMPAFGGGLLRIDRYSHLGSNATEIVTNLVTNPTLMLTTMFSLPKLSYLLWIFLPVAFLPLLNWRGLILLIPGLLENLLTDFTSQFTGLYQYDSVLVASIFIGVIFGLKTILERWPSKEKLLERIGIAAVVIGFVMHSPVNPFFFPAEIFSTNQRWDAYRALVRAVPAEVPVAAHTNLVPHLANREHIAMLGTEKFIPDIILIDALDGFGFKDSESFQVYVDKYANSGNYEVEILLDRYIVMKKFQ